MTTVDKVLLVSFLIGIGIVLGLLLAINLLTLEHWQIVPVEILNA